MTTLGQSLEVTENAIFILISQRDKARATSVALENELSRLRAGVEQVVHSIESDSCECGLRLDGEDDLDIICVRCHRITLLTPPCATEVDALGQRTQFDPSVLVPDCSLDKLLREATG